MKNVDGEVEVMVNSTVVVSDKNVKGDLSIDNTGVYIDGVKQGSSDIIGRMYDEGSSMNVHVSIVGNIGKVFTTSGDVSVDGDVKGGIFTTSGDVEVDGDIEGNVSTTSGDVKADQFNGSFTTTSGGLYN